MTNPEPRKVQTSVYGFDNRPFIVGSFGANGTTFIGDKSMSLRDQYTALATEQRSAVIAEAKTWIGTKFHDSAMVKSPNPLHPEFGAVACGPLLIAVYRSIGIPVGTPNWALFPRDWHLHTTEERYYNMVAEYSKPVESPEPGDMVLCRFNRADKPPKPYCHGGIVVKWPSIVIHAYWGKGVEEIDLSKGPLEKREKVFLSPWA